MREHQIQLLVCPECSGRLELGSVQRRSVDHVETGNLVCTGCNLEFPIVDSIPRFVPVENYADSFGLEWNTHARTQYDEETRLHISEDRFWHETHWPHDLRGETILEAGSGSGRFTTHAASTGATVISFDYSSAVEANFASNGHHPNVVIVQGDIFSIPVPKDSADRAFCFGVLQHTPDPHGAFLALISRVAPGGSIAFDVYRKTRLTYLTTTKYWVRPLTRRMDSETLYRRVQRYVDAMWPIASAVRRIPRIGPSLNWRLLVADYSREGVADDALKEWAYLDTFDMLAPEYDLPQRLEDVQSWLEEAGLERAEAHDGYNGIEAHGVRPPEVRSS
jgi:uncharacterized protein YbaR (Trm112 family)/ubiquinone/menaquinone biosynthesis C-methylase UbiE